MDHRRYPTDRSIAFLASLRSRLARVKGQSDVVKWYHLCLPSMGREFDSRHRDRLTDVDESDRFVLVNAGRVASVGQTAWLLSQKGKTMSSITFKGPDEISVPINFVGMYSDDTPMIKSEDFYTIVNQCNTLILRAHSLMAFVEAMFLVDSVHSMGGNIEKLVIPYLPGARQDRVNPTGDVLFTARSVAAMINQRSFREVVILDPHSPVMPSMIHRVVEYPLEAVANKLWQGYTGIISADKGGRDRAEQFAHAMGLPIFYGGKTRDVSTGKLTGFTLESIPEDGHFLVVDDICDGGGTFIGLGEKIKEQGAFADLYVSHGIFSKGTEQLNKTFKNIYTTDSRRFHERNNVNVIKVVEDMENYND